MKKVTPYIVGIAIIVSVFAANVAWTVWKASLYAQIICK